MHPNSLQSKPLPSMNSLKVAPCFLLYLVDSCVSDYIPLVDRVLLVETLLTIVTLGGVVALIGLDWRVSAFNAALAATIFDTRAFLSDKLVFWMTTTPLYHYSFRSIIACLIYRLVIDKFK